MNLHRLASDCQTRAVLWRLSETTSALKLALVCAPARDRANQGQSLRDICSVIIKWMDGDGNKTREDVIGSDEVSLHLYLNLRR